MTMQQHNRTGLFSLLQSLATTGLEDGQQLLTGATLAAKCRFINIFKAKCSWQAA